MESKKYTFIQYLRMLALILVLWDHIIPSAYYGMGVAPPASIVERYIIWPLAITNYFGTYAVDLFFLITGFLAMDSVKRTGPVSYLLKRGMRLAPGIVFGCLFYLGVLFTTRMTTSGGQMSTSLGIAAYLSANGGLWYVRVLLYFCVIFACCIPFLRKDLLMGTILCQIITVLICQVAPQPAVLGNIGAACSYIFYITVGMAIYVLDNYKTHAFPAFAVLFVISWYGIIHYNIAVFNPERAEVGNSFGVSAMYSILTFLVFFFADERLAKMRIVEEISKYSYGMYLHHMPVFSIVLPAIGALSLPLRMTCYVTAGITLLLTFFASYVQMRWVDAPCGRLTKKLLRGLNDGQI